MEWTVSEVADRAGISVRTLRHYHRIGLLPPDRVGANGYRHYGPVAVARLQRILLLRETGMGLPEIRAVLDAPETPAAEVRALEAHLDRLAAERDLLERRIAAVEHTLDMRRQGLGPRMDVMLQGFNDAYEDEVVERWGRDAFDAAHGWWHGMGVRRQRAWKVRAEGLLTRWREIQEEGHAPGSAAAQEHADTHLAWFAEIPGTPAHAGDAATTAGMVRGVAAGYEADPEFRRAFGSADAARFAAAALRSRVAHMDRLA